MVEFLMRGRHSDKGQGKLVCPACWSPKLRFIEKVGLDIEIWKCRQCNQLIRYCTTPLDPVALGASVEDAKKLMRQGLTKKELDSIDTLGRAKQRGITWLPGIGQFKVKRHKLRPKD